MSTYQTDVVIVGAGIAGCTAAILYGRAGLKVALLEKQPTIHAYKKLCTHYIQASAKPTMDRLGVSSLIEQAGGLANGLDIWTKWGWIRAADDARFPRHGYSIRREKLDPLLRRLAADTPGVTLFLGHAVKELVKQNGVICGLVAAQPSQKEIHTFYGNLVVAADGHYSKCAALSAVKTKYWANGRFGYFAYYRQVALTSGPLAQMWFLDPAIAYAFPNDDDITLLAVMPLKEETAVFKQNPAAHLEKFVAALPAGPDMRRAERLSSPLGILKGQCHLRPAALPGLAFIGDAAASTDPLWGCGCGWAFQTAEWLVSETTGALQQERSVKPALQRYQKKHYRQLAAQNWFNGSFASGRSFYSHERLVMAAAARDRTCARHIQAFAGRHIGVRRLFSPLNFARAGWINLKHALF